MSRFFVCAFASAAFGAALGGGPAAEKPAPHPLGYVCPRANGRVTIDGKLDEPAWQTAPWSADFVDIEGDAKPKPRLRTRMKMLWDDQALYIAAEMEEPHLWSTLEQHDSVIFHDNDFEVFLDPDGDNHLYGELEVNLKNTTWDLLLTKPYRDAGLAINAWEIVGLQTAVRLDGTLNDPRDLDRGWTLEIAWPWKGLAELSSAKTPPQVGDQWRINFSRVEWDLEVIDGAYRKVPKRPEHNWVWSPQGAIDMHRPERWGYVQFAEKADAPFRPDPDHAIRDGLMRIYRAQRERRLSGAGHARTLEELGLAREALPKGVRLDATREQFVAEAPASTPGHRLRVTHDSHLRRIDPTKKR